MTSTIPEGGGTSAAGTATDDDSPLEVLDTTTLSTQPRDVSQQPRIGVVGTLRWAWRQLTSMRTALLLLFLLALAAVPGSLLPQRSVDPTLVDLYIAHHPTLGPFTDRLSGFAVFSAPWFAATHAPLSLSP